MNTKPAPFAEPGPDLYRRNPFRISGLTVHATARDIRRRTEEMRVKARLGADAGTGSAPLPLDPPPDPDAVQAALQRLRDPVRRLEDELFWFWPAHNASVQGARDEALEALRDGRIEDAERLWADPAPGRAAAVAAHNLAVLAHARALDADRPQDRELWAPALRHWRTVLDTDAFWDLVAARARAADDPRLGPGAADELRERLPAALMTIAAQVAVRSSRDGDATGAAALTAVVHDSGFDEAAVDAAFREAAAPETDRLRALARSALDRAEASPENACDEAVHILDHTEPALDGLTIVLGEDHPVMEGVRDEIAERVQQCTIIYGNETEDWSKAEEILTRAGALAATVTIKTRIQKNLDTAGDNLLYGTCWFCGENSADDKATYEKKMYGNVREEFGGYMNLQRQIRWQKLAVPVPRCAPCAAAHRGHGREVAGFGCGGGAGALVLAIVLIAAGAPPALPGILVFLVIIGFFAVMSSGNVDGLPKGAHATLGSWPPIRERLDAGWLFGEKPPNIN
ncbi:hypothetical protein [Actinomadura algeriensis]|uniref:Tetratricopeptide repeat protein n=1 Tax=Actinomadura algeriensis TaxID=1679523 RepID=A0ABR9JKV1_9ACTN|nr:hypothetical protein [Actinomadura algeriensis]MBE1531182.1 hypothetical protein [Actinomadura algeriensis]